MGSRDWGEGEARARAGIGTNARLEAKAYSGNKGSPLFYLVQSPETILSTRKPSLPGIPVEQCLVHQFFPNPTKHVLKLLHPATPGAPVFLNLHETSFDAVAASNAWRHAPHSKFKKRKTWLFAQTVKGTSDSSKATQTQVSYAYLHAQLPKIQSAIISYCTIGDDGITTVSATR